MNKIRNATKDQGIDFTYFSIIGTNAHILDKNITNFDHWLYGHCNNEVDGKGIINVIVHDYFNKSACIRKYNNSKEGKYFNTDEEGFQSPIIAHGNFNQNSKFYHIVVGKCQQETLDLIYDKGYKCKNQSEIEEIFSYMTIHFNFIDEFIDVLKYENPIKKFLFKLKIN